MPEASTAAANSPIVIWRRRRAVSQCGRLLASQDLVPDAAAIDVIAVIMHCTHIAPPRLQAAELPLEPSQGDAVELRVVLGGPMVPPG
jgi:hypothetical protein